MFKWILFFIVLISNSLYSSYSDQEKEKAKDILYSMARKKYNLIKSAGYFRSFTFQPRDQCIEGCRYMWVDLLTSWQDAVNRAHHSKPFLDHYPFCYKNVEMAIKFFGMMPDPYKDIPVVVYTDYEEGLIGYVLMRYRDRRSWCYFETVDQAWEALAQGRGSVIDESKLTELKEEKKPLPPIKPF